MTEHEAPLDSGVLKPHQVSDQECEILLQIEDRLREVEWQSELPEQARRQDRKRHEAEGAEFEAAPLAVTENRYQRVLLLDGARGTGKTSFILTLINRWHHAVDPLAENTAKWELDAAQIKRVLPKAGVATAEAPKNVRVLRNLDFDPLPPRMPVLAAIVQAWRPLVERFDTETFGGNDFCDENGGRRLMDSWHSLFRVAATGRSELPRSKGLIEQVLDREEQVKDWQHLREYWLWFVNEVIGTGRRLKSEHQLRGEPAFVIVIDDVDLQVERVSELLPALRLLTHPNVFFLVAADSFHMIDMLKFDFLGQQQRLAESRGDGLTMANKWASTLAAAAFEKAFPIRNRWVLEPLTLSKALDYPPATAVGVNDKRRTLGRVLSQICRKSNPLNESKYDQKFSNTVELAIERLANAADVASVGLPALSYRSTQQLWQTVSDLKNVDEEHAAAVLARLVSPDPLVPAQVLKDDDRTIFVPTLGGLAAAYRPTAIDPGGQDNVIVSARPDFLYISPEGSISRMSATFELSARLIASTLQELNFPVSTATSWDVRLAFAWTEWPRLKAIFGWPWHTHPRPDELLEQTENWSRYLKAAGAVAEKKKIRDRYAYAWIYFERARYVQRAGIKMPSVPDPVSLVKETHLPWEKLLSPLKKSPMNDELKRWGQYTLPLLARPEVGLDPDLQEILLKHSTLSPSVVSDLWNQRRRMATDAVVVASLRRGEKRDEPSGKDVDDLLAQIEAHHREVHRKPSPWFRRIERKPTQNRRPVGTRGQKRTPRRAGS